MVTCVGSNPTLCSYFFFAFSHDYWKTEEAFICLDLFIIIICFCFCSCFFFFIHCPVWFYAVSAIERTTATKAALQSFPKGCYHVKITTQHALESPRRSRRRFFFVHVPHPLCTWMHVRDRLHCHETERHWGMPGHAGAAPRESSHKWPALAWRVAARAELSRMPVCPVRPSTWFETNRSLLTRHRAVNFA